MGKKIYIVILLSTAIIVVGCATPGNNHFTESDAREALLNLVKYNSVDLPETVFEDAEDPDSLQIVFSEPGSYSSHAVTVHLSDRTYEVRWPSGGTAGDEFCRYHWKGAFVLTSYGSWTATLPVEWTEQIDFTE